jgi:hypothetical protein
MCPLVGRVQNQSNGMGRFTDGLDVTVGEGIESYISVASERNKASSTSTPR